MNRAKIEEKIENMRRLLFLALRTLKELEKLHEQNRNDQLQLPLSQIPKKRKSKRTR